LAAAANSVDLVYRNPRQKPMHVDRLRRLRSAFLGRRSKASGVSPFLLRTADPPPASAQGKRVRPQQIRWLAALIH
jgi:hypothetical protein